MLFKACIMLKENIFLIFYCILAEYLGKTFKYRKKTAKCTFLHNYVFLDSFSLISCVQAMIFQIAILCNRIGFYAIKTFGNQTSRK